MIKNVLCNKSKNASVRFFIYMSSMCVQLFTAFEEAVLKLLCTLVSALTSLLSTPFHTFLFLTTSFTLALKDVHK